MKRAPVGAAVRDRPGAFIAAAEPAAAGEGRVGSGWPSHVRTHTGPARWGGGEGMRAPEARGAGVGEGAVAEASRLPPAEEKSALISASALAFNRKKWETASGPITRQGPFSASGLRVSGGADATGDP